MKNILISTILLLLSTKVFAKNNCELNIKNYEYNSLVWIGDCKKGYAEGNGLLKGYNQKNEVLFLYYGVLENGQLKFGILEINNGYKVEKYDSDFIALETTRNEIITAFDQAGNIALAYSLELEKIGNKTSAEYYKKKSIELYNQMD